jgi:hypothetical protein
MPHNDKSLERARGVVDPGSSPAPGPAVSRKRRQPGAGEPAADGSLAEHNGAQAARGDCGDDDLGDCPIPSDALAALRLLRSQFPQLPGVSAPRLCPRPAAASAHSGSHPPLIAAAQ